MNRKITTTDLGIVKLGVSLGSVIGLLLFLIFIKVLSNNVILRVRLFVNEYIIYRKIKHKLDTAE